MELYSDEARALVGSDIEFPEWDPLGYTKTATPEKLAWYRGTNSLLPQSFFLMCSLCLSC
jgi:hypothetical protein